MFDFKELCMNAKELANLVRAFVLALDEVLNYDELGEATLKHYGPINDDQRKGVKEFFQALKSSKLSEDELDKTLQELDADAFCAELLKGPESEEE